MIDNPRAGRIRAVAQLSRRSVRAERGRFLVEGPQAVREALQWRPELLLEVYATPDAADRHRSLITALEQDAVEVVLVADRVLAVLADTVTPQGMVAVARIDRTELDAVAASRPRLVAIMHEVRDPGNAGTVIRVADAAGADAVILTGESVDPFNPKAVRASTGSLFHLPVVSGATLDAAVAALHGAGVRVLAADIKGDDLLEARQEGALDARTAWLFGNEARGLDAEVLAKVDASIAVPIYGRAESMNLATAAAVCLYESAFAQRSAGFPVE